MREKFTYGQIEWVPPMDAVMSSIGGIVGGFFAECAALPVEVTGISKREA
jgi:hypothetical protein